MKMVWGVVSWLLLLPCSLALKYQHVIRSQSIGQFMSTGQLFKVAMSSIAVPEPWTDWATSGWVYIINMDPQGSDILGLSSPNLAVFIDSNLNMRTTLGTVSTPLTSGYPSDKWFHLILASRTGITYAVLASLDNSPKVTVMTTTNVALTASSLFFMASNQNSFTVRDT